MNPRQNQMTEEEAISRIRMPKRKDLEMFAIATQMLGADKIKAMCEDGKERVCRIPGKLRKRVWIREGDLIIVKLWDFQPIKGDIVWRYIKVQTNYLKRKGLLDKLPIEDGF
ncbi:translation initiation factor eIF-1A [Candidatus Micrarchaeota archaeon]|nr:translation initiation factor eIF-1A [Candidatus Micrarchaeota archaeon]MBU2476372.1 translation initiation factor eIF-1A [Candidatus Micrarchaeota archaeon]